MPFSENDRVVPQSPKDIKVILSGPFPMTSEQVEVIRALQHRLFDHNQQAGVNYNQLHVAGPSTKDRMATEYGSFGVMQQNGKIAFGTNIQTLLGFQSNNEVMDFIIGHESGHVKANDSGFTPKLQIISNIIESSSRIATSLRLNPDATKDAIHAEFGSVAALQSRLNRFAQDALPVVSAMESRTDIFSATPEKMARLMENGDAEHTHMHALGRQLPRSKPLEHLSHQLDEVEKKTKKLITKKPPASSLSILDSLKAFNFPEEQKSGLFGNLKKTVINLFSSQKTRALPVSAITIPLNKTESTLAETLENFGGYKRTSPLRDFAINHSKANEYVADSYSLTLGNNPAAAKTTLTTLIQSTIPLDDYNKEETLKRLMDTDGPFHPSETQRIKRLDALHTDGKPPPDEVLRPPEPESKFGNPFMSKIMSAIDAATLGGLEKVGKATDTSEIILATKDVPNTNKKNEVGG